MLTFTDNFENDKELILRDHLALERTKLANEKNFVCIYPYGTLPFDCGDRDISN